MRAWVRLGSSSARYGDRDEVGEQREVTPRGEEGRPQDGRRVTAAVATGTTMRGAVTDARRIHGARPKRGASIRGLTASEWRNRGRTAGGRHGTLLGRWTAGQPCFENILAETDVSACITKCLMGAPGEGLSVSCVSCYFEIVRCGTENCITQCAVDSNSPLCSACFLEHCGPRVEERTGLPLVPTP